MQKRSKKRVPENRGLVVDVLCEGCVRDNTKTGLGVAGSEGLDFSRISTPLGPLMSPVGEGDQLIASCGEEAQSSLKLAHQVYAEHKVPRLEGAGGIYRLGASAWV
jgi:hypothetical protein